MPAARRTSRPSASRDGESGLAAPDPQLATLVTAPPAGDEWLHEQKFDGYRILAVRDGASVRLLTRRHNDWSETLAPLAAAIAALPAERVILDGELVVFAADGRTSFQALQNALGAGARGVVYVAFDLLQLGDRDLRPLPLEERKRELAALVGRLPRAVAAVIRYSDHVAGNGEAFFREACAAGLEGIVSKRRDRPYRAGRGLDWVKTKCLQRQELVIGGFTEPRGSRTGLGALLVGYHEGGALRYAGKVGTGFGARVLDELHAALARLERPRSPFTPAPARAWTGPGVHWVEPRLVAEVSFAEWTDDGRLRHPVFKGLRRDKPASAIVRERPVAATRASARG
ncbi:MAG TPA: non-homologous end-joining DNA ligase [Kofleriaceae bacterium]|nr:non-homologous end-joining DNA ligase [Kofleriaceae bacterium]